MATTLTVSEARAALPSLLDRVLAGEEVTITRHGTPVAVLVRPDALRSRRATEALERAAALRAALLESREAPLPEPAMSVERADELVAGLRADRRRR